MSKARSLYPTLFLDVDDVIVLNRTVGFDKHAVCDLAQAICQQLIHPPAGQALTELLTEHPARIVITSNWLRFTSREALERLFRLAGYEQLAQSLHEAWCAPGSSATNRAQAINNWLKEHHRGEPFCIVDDQHSGASLVGSSHDKTNRVLLCSVGVGLHRGHLPFVRAALATAVM